MTEGVRFPTMAFITGGAGQADDGIPPQPFETFCYDSALLEARIENFNVVPYTSVLPKEMYGNIVPINDDIVKQFKHGAVLEVIMDDIARGHAEMWLTKSLNHELSIRGVEKHSEFQMWHNYVNITQQFGYSLTALGFLNFEHADPAKFTPVPPQKL